MPDLVTHTAIASFFADKKYRYVFFLLLGAVLPDVSRLGFILFSDNHQAFWFFSAMHTPFVQILLAVLVVQFFAPAIRKPALGWLLVGLATHFGLDALQRHLSEFAYAWAFPFSFQGYSWGLFWPEDPLYVALPLALVSILWFWWRRRKVN